MLPNQPQKRRRYWDIFQRCIYVVVFAALKGLKHCTKSEEVFNGKLYFCAGKQELFDIVPWIDLRLNVLTTLEFPQLSHVLISRNRIQNIYGVFRNKEMKVRFYLKQCWLPLW